MKTWNFVLALLAFFCCAADSRKALAQIPNAGFEQWTAGNPDGWLVFNQPGGTNVTPTTDARSGSWAVKGEVITFQGSPFSPWVISGVDGEGFPVNSREQALHGWYKFSPLGSDQFQVSVDMVLVGASVGAGGFVSAVPQPVYREFVANITYAGSETPDTCTITIRVSTHLVSTNVGTAYRVDDLSFGPVSAVDGKGNLLPDEYALHQNYPNPFNPSTFIQYAIAKSGVVDLRVYDILGREVATLVSGFQEAGSYRAEFEAHGFTSGVYFYRLQSGEFSQVKKLTIVK